MKNKTVDVKWDGKGSGFRNESESHIYLIRCPECNRENYIMNVPLGVCTWCGFNANELQFKK